MWEGKKKYIYKKCKVISIYSDIKTRYAKSNLGGVEVVGKGGVWWGCAVVVVCLQCKVLFK